MGVQLDREDRATEVLITPRTNRSSLFAGALIFLYITFEAPLSGMSMNPARSAASAIGAARGDSLWIYFLAPLLGMELAAEARRARKGRVLCAKLHHENGQRCIFRCAYAQLGKASPGRRGKE
jgi:aquaporin Z